MLTGAQRYRQATLKARIIARRELRAFMAGEIGVLPCSGDREVEFIRRELERAYAAGLAAGMMEARGR